MAATHWSDARAELKRMRETQERSPSKVLRLAVPLLDTHSHRLGDEVWVVYEQTCIAALDCNQPDVFRRCQKAIEDKFGKKSVRVALLEGQRLESERKYEDAEALYKTLLKDEPTSAKVMKRATAIKMAQQDLPGAIKKLTEYLDKFAADAEGWTELASLYLKDSRFECAKFCYEELILTNPYNHHFHERYAEVLYTLGGNANLALARKHFTQAANLNPKSARALYGLLMVTKRLALGGDKEAAEMAKRTEEMLKALYAGSPNVKQLEGLLATMSVK